LCSRTRIFSNEGISTFVVVGCSGLCNGHTCTVLGEPGQEPTTMCHSPEINEVATLESCPLKTVDCGSKRPDDGNECTIKVPQNPNNARCVCKPNMKIVVPIPRCKADVLDQSVPQDCIPSVLVREVVRNQSVLGFVE